jgi:fucose 4-O-acetylase-like acetyltransferase
LHVLPLASHFVSQAGLKRSAPRLFLLHRYKEFAMPVPGRDTHVDNIKAVLIFLVIFGHLIETNIANDGALKAVWVFIYAFHMPMFALVSGMFSKASLSESQSNRLAANIVIPLLAFELLYEALELATTGKPSAYVGQIAPYWLLWYLFSLLCWRLMLTLFSRIRLPLTIAVAISLGASFSDDTGYYLGISRTLTFFPFFLLGWKFGPRLLSFSGRKMTVAGIAVLIVAMVAAFQLDQLDHRWLYGSYSLPRLEMANLDGLLLQLLLYGVSALVGLAFINLVPRRHLGIAWLGRHSMYAYLWHGFAILLLSKAGALDLIFGLGTLPALALLALISSIILLAATRPRWIALTENGIFRPLAKLLIKESVSKPALPARV